MTGNETHIHWPARVSRAPARARRAPALRMESFLEPLFTRPPPADFRPALHCCPAPQGAGNAGISQSLRACGRGGWGLKDSKGAPPPRSRFPGLSCGKKAQFAGGEAKWKAKTESGLEVWCVYGAAGSGEVAWGEEDLEDGGG